MAEAACVCVSLCMVGGVVGTILWLRPDPDTESQPEMLVAVFFSSRSKSTLRFRARDI